MKARLCGESLHACSGCEMALLNCGARLPALLDRLDIVHFPLLMDNKHRRPGHGETSLALPQADIGLVSGGVAHSGHVTVLSEMRRQTTILVALGTCATHGGIPAMLNQWSPAEGLRAAFSTPTTEPAPLPDHGVPAFLDRVYSIDEKTQVDISLPGCPPNPEQIADLLEALAGRQQWRQSGKSVCDTCPTHRTGRSQTAVARRFLANADAPAGEPGNDMRCLLEQGLVCMGPVTAGGCGGKATPLCLRAKVPCRGCYGPVRPSGNPLLDMMNALASSGIDHRTIVDRKSLLRFSGAHNLLRPARPRPGPGGMPCQPGEHP